MLFLFMAFSVLCLVSAKFAGVKSFHTDYLHKDNTTAVNGIFVGLVFFSHISGYLDLADTGANHWFKVLLNIGQYMVTTFLFYSGYGMICSLKAKGSTYIKRIPVHRFFKTWSQFAVVIFMYLAINLAIGNHVALKDFLLALTGYGALGNSNWYIFIILILYLVFYVAFTLSKSRIVLGTVIFSLATAALTIWFHFAHFPPYFYNTMLCFPAGMWYALGKDKIESFIMKNNAVYFASLLISGIGVVAVRKTIYHIFGELMYPLSAIFFVLFIVIATMKIRFRNKMLTFLGSHVFEIYALQRLPMILLENYGFNLTHPYLFFLICAAVTVGLSVLFQKCVKIVLSKKKKTVNCN